LVAAEGGAAAAVEGWMGWAASGVPPWRRRWRRAALPVAGASAGGAARFRERFCLLSLLLL
jgi:hypothetical protein